MCIDQSTVRAPAGTHAVCLHSKAPTVRARCDRNPPPLRLAVYLATPHGALDLLGFVDTNDPRVRHVPAGTRLSPIAPADMCTQHGEFVFPKAAIAEKCNEPATPAPPSVDVHTPLPLLLDNAAVHAAAAAWTLFRRSGGRLTARPPAPVLAALCIAIGALAPPGVRSSLAAFVAATVDDDNAFNVDADAMPAEMRMAILLDGTPPSRIPWLLLLGLGDNLVVRAWLAADAPPPPESLRPFWSAPRRARALVARAGPGLVDGMARFWSEHCGILRAAEAAEAVVEQCRRNPRPFLNNLDEPLFSARPVRTLASSDESSRSASTPTTSAVGRGTGHPFCGQPPTPLSATVDIEDLGLRGAGLCTPLCVRRLAERSAAPGLYHRDLERLQWRKLCFELGYTADEVVAHMYRHSVDDGSMSKRQWLANQYENQVRTDFAQWEQQRAAGRQAAWQSYGCKTLQGRNERSIFGGLSELDGTDAGCPFATASKAELRQLADGGGGDADWVDEALVARRRGDEAALRAVCRRQYGSPGAVSERVVTPVFFIASALQRAGR